MRRRLGAVIMAALVLGAGAACAPPATPEPCPTVDFVESTTTPAGALPQLFRACEGTAQLPDGSWRTTTVDGRWDTTTTTASVDVGYSVNAHGSSAGSWALHLGATSPTPGTYPIDVVSFEGITTATGTATVTEVTVAGFEVTHLRATFTAAGGDATVTGTLRLG